MCRFQRKKPENGVLPWEVYHAKTALEEEHEHEHAQPLLCSASEQFLIYPGSNST